MERTKNYYVQIAHLCRYYRKYVLDFTLREMADVTGINYKSLSAFENGRANNIEHLSAYIELMDLTTANNFFREVFELI